MEVNFWLEILFSIIIAAIIGIIAGLISNKTNDGKVGVGCGIMFPVALIIFICLKILIPGITVVTYENGTFSHKNIEFIGEYKTSTGNKISTSLGNTYITNNTSEPLLLYPAYYGSKDQESSIKQENPIVIEPFSIIQIAHKPDIFFTEPENTITTKSKSIEVRWVLESLNTVYRREGTSTNETYNTSSN